MKNIIDNVDNYELVKEISRLKRGGSPCELVYNTLFDGYKKEAPYHLFLHLWDRL